MSLEIITSLLTSSLITSVFVFFLNKAIENKFDMKLEAYKDKLKSESDRELMQLTKDLELKATERSIKLARVFEHQADTIANTYEKLLWLLNLVQDYSELTEKLEEPTKKEKLAEVQTAFKDFQNFYLPKKIYLPSGTALKIKDVSIALADLIGNKRMADINRGFIAINPNSGITLTLPDAPETKLTLEEAVAKFDKGIEELKIKIPTLLAAIEDDFQDIFGLKIDDKKQSK
jgi:hypothetical protein